MSATPGVRDWSQAATLEDLCALTAAWLRGDIPYQPNYYGPVDVDEDEAPGITEALIAANEAGILTHSSQAGFGHMGALVTGLASVAGYISEATFQRLAGLSPIGGPDAVYKIAWHPVGKWCSVRQNGVIVTRVMDRRLTTFGNQVNRRYLRGEFEESPLAWPALYAARQFVLWDPEPGRNTLWADLVEVVGR